VLRGILIPETAGIEEFAGHHADLPGPLHHGIYRTRASAVAYPHLARLLPRHALMHSLGFAGLLPPHSEPNISPDHVCAAHGHGALTLRMANGNQVATTALRRLLH